MFQIVVELVVIGRQVNNKFSLRCHLAHNNNTWYYIYYETPSLIAQEWHFDKQHYSTMSEL